MRRPPSGPPGPSSATVLRVGPIVSPDHRFALELYARAVAARPRDWGVSPAELAARAEREPAARDLLLWYAAAVARDRGEHEEADRLLARALDPAPADGEWLLEHRLQQVLADALVRRDAAAARARLGALPPHPSAPAYPLLAEAAVLLAEGRTDDAAAALAGWTRAARAYPAGARRLEVGNRWALELLAERLGPTRVERHGTFLRAFLLAAGLLFLVSFGALCVAVAAVIPGEVREGGAGRAVAPAVGVLLFAALAAYGGHLAVRGILGRSLVWSEARLARADAAILRATAAIPWRWTPVVALAVGWAGSPTPIDFVLLRGSAPARAAWTFLAAWVVWTLHVALHEAGHALAAVAVGARVEELAIGPARLVREEGGWRWRRVPDGRLFVGGHVRHVLDGRRHARARHLVTVAAGPAVSLALAIGCGSALAAGAGQHPAASRILLVATLAGAWGFLTSATPSRRRVATDGTIAGTILRGGFWYGSAGAMLAAHLAEGRRARDWDVPGPEIEAAARRAGAGRAWGLVLAAARALDGGDPATAEGLLREAADDAHADRGERMEAILQLALVDALHRGDAAAARARIAEARALGAAGYAGLADAAACAAQGDADGARSALAAWNRLVDGAENPASVRVGNHWAIDVLAARLRADPPE